MASRILSGFKRNAIVVIILTFASSTALCAPTWRTETPARVRARCLYEFLQPDPPFVPSDAAWAQSLASSLTAGSATDRVASRRLYDFVRLSISYDATRPKDGFPWYPQQTLARKRGSCVDDTLLYLTLCRAVGIPARFASGIGRQGNHDWAQVYLVGEGWVHVDAERGRLHDRFGRLYPDLIGHWWPDTQNCAPAELAMGRAYAANRPAHRRIR